MEKLTEKLNHIKELLEKGDQPGKPSTKQGPIAAPKAPEPVAAIEVKKVTVAPGNKKSAVNAAEQQDEPIKDIAMNAAESLQYNKLGQWKLNSKQLTTPSLKDVLPKLPQAPKIPKPQKL